MDRDSKRIGEEFELGSESEAVKEYSSLNRDFMYPNIYDLKKDASQEVAFEISEKMPSLQRRAFLESVREAIDSSYLENILKGLNVSQYSVAPFRYSRRTILKNRDVLRESRFLGERFNRILVEIALSK